MLQNLKSCLNGVVLAHSEKKALRGSLLTSRNRATLLHQVVTIGDAVREDIVKQTNAEDVSSIPFICPANHVRVFD